MVSKVLCMEIGKSVVRIAEVLPGGRNQVTQLFELPVPLGTISEGVIRKNTDFIESVKKELEKRNIKTKKVIFTINSSRIAVRQITIPKVREAHIRESLITNSSEYFPVDISEYEIGYRVLRKIKKGKKEQLSLSVAVVPKDLIQGYVEMAKACELRFAGIDYVGNSVSSCLMQQKEEDVSVLLKVEEDSILFQVYEKDRILFQRMLPYGLDEDADSESMEAMMENIQNMFNYYNSNVSQKPIKQVFVAGIGAKSDTFINLLEKFLNLPVEYMTELERVILSGKAAGTENLLEYIGVIGAAYMPLFPVGDEKRGIQEKLNTREATRFARYTCVALVGVAVLLAVVPLVYGAYLKIKIASVEREIQKYATEQAIYEKYEATLLGLQDAQLMYSHTENANENMVELLGELEKKLPTESRVISLSADEGIVSINLELKQKEDAAAALVQLRTFQQFSNVVTTGLTEEEDENGKKTILMNVVMTYALEGGAADEAVN